MHTNKKELDDNFCMYLRYYVYKRFDVFLNDLKGEKKLSKVPEFIKEDLVNQNSFEGIFKMVESK